MTYEIFPNIIKDLLNNLLGDPSVTRYNGGIFEYPYKLQLIKWLHFVIKRILIFTRLNKQKVFRRERLMFYWQRNIKFSLSTMSQTKLLALINQ